MLKEKMIKEWISHNELVKTHHNLVDDIRAIQEENVKLWEVTKVPQRKWEIKKKGEVNNVQSCVWIWERHDDKIKKNTESWSRFQICTQHSQHKNEK